MKFKQPFKLFYYLDKKESLEIKSVEVFDIDDLEKLPTNVSWMPPLELQLFCILAKAIGFLEE